MNRSEIATAIGIVKARYPRSTWGPDDVLTVEAWHMSLGDLPADAVKRALAALFHESEFAPDPVDVRRWLLADTGLAPEPGDAWRMVQRAIRAYYPGQGCDVALPEPVKRAVQASGGLHTLKQSDEPSRDRDAFLRAYAAYRKRALAVVGLGLPAIAETASSGRRPSKSGRMPSKAPVLERGA